jgi:hypothetical protein
LAIERAGHRGSVTDPEARAIDCIVHHQSITIRLESKTMRTKNDPNGRERLDINVRGKNAYRLRSEWNERRSFVPEEHIARIASGTVLAAELERRDAEYARYREQRRMWEERVKEQREVEQAAKRKATETLLVQATAFRQAKEIRELVAAAHRIGSGCLEFAHWQAWALQEADRLDPLAGGTPPWSHPDGNSTPNGAKRYSRTG